MQNLFIKKLCLKIKKKSPAAMQMPDQLVQRCLPIQETSRRQMFLYIGWGISIQIQFGIKIGWI